MLDLDRLSTKLAEDEIAILSGDSGKMLQKVMETVVLYADALGSEKLVDIEGEGHFVISWALPWLAPSIKMLEDLVDAGLKTKHPFTVDPCAPLDFENLKLADNVEKKIEVMFKDQAYYKQMLLSLGLRDENAFTCNPYQPEVGNIPKQGTVLAWSESACAVFANSFLGARTNRNGAIMDLLSNIVGKTPYSGLVTDEGRQAKWLLEIRTDELPTPQLLGAVIGKLVVGDVPYIVGLDQLLGGLNKPELTDYLHEMGAACATFGAVGLYHIENITPEALAQGKDLLRNNYKQFEIDAECLEEELFLHTKKLSEIKAKPEVCYIGCPHLSLQQLSWWIKEISKAMSKDNKEELAIDTILFSAPQILEKLKADGNLYNKLLDSGVTISPTCCETIFETGLLSGKRVLSNSSKLHAYTSSLFMPDDKLINTIVTGEIPGENSYA